MLASRIQNGIGSKMLVDCFFMGVTEVMQLHSSDARADGLDEAD